jgi:hypothetical protein
MVTFVIAALEQAGNVRISLVLREPVAMCRRCLGLRYWITEASIHKLSTKFRLLDFPGARAETHYRFSKLP